VAVVVVNEMRGGDQSMYDEINPRVMSEGRLPDGCRVHIAGPTDDGWRVITVWESEERFQQFREEALIPALQDSGYGDRVAPEITTGEVYKLLTA
jgi:hypothetical protein